MDAWTDSHAPRHEGRGLSSGKSLRDQEALKMQRENTQQLGRRNAYTPRDAAPVSGSVAARLNSSERVGAVLRSFKTRPNNSEEHPTPKPKGGGGQDLRVPVLNMRGLDGRKKTEKVRGD